MVVCRVMASWHRGGRGAGVGPRGALGVLAINRSLIILPKIHGGSAAAT
jgi:hypothetical protein